MKNIELPFVQKKKRKSLHLVLVRRLIKKEGMEKIPRRELDMTLRKATLSATTSPWLRAIVMVGESDSHYYVSVIQSKEESLSLRELAGALLKPKDDVFPIKEENIYFFIKPENLYKALYDEINHHHLNTLALANIHHDYVRYFGDEDALKEVMIFHLLHNGFEEASKVISSM